MTVMLLWLWYSKYDYTTFLRHEKHCVKKQPEYLKRRQDNPVTPTVKMVNFSHEQKQKDELSKALDKYRSTGSPKPSTSNVKSPPYALTKEQNDIELSPLFHILQVCPLSK